MHHSSDAAIRNAPPKRASTMDALPYHIECQPADGKLTFRCESCDRELNDLRGVFLSHHSGSGWAIECASHAEEERSMDAGHLFGGGLRSLELFADLARAPWFDARELFETLSRLRAQARGVYRCRTGGARQFR